jgi:hypothetical protein
MEETHLAPSPAHLANQSLKEGTLRGILNTELPQTSRRRTLPLPTRPTIATKEPFGTRNAMSVSSNGVSLSVSLSRSSLSSLSSAVLSGNKGKSSTFLRLGKYFHRRCWLALDFFGDSRNSFTQKWSNPLVVNLVFEYRIP